MAAVPVVARLIFERRAFNSKTSSFSTQNFCWFVGVGSCTAVEVVEDNVAPLIAQKIG